MGSAWTDRINKGVWRVFVLIEEFFWKVLGIILKRFRFQRIPRRWVEQTWLPWPRGWRFWRRGWGRDPDNSRLCRCWPSTAPTWATGLPATRGLSRCCAAPRSWRPFLTPCLERLLLRRTELGGR